MGPATLLLLLKGTVSSNFRPLCYLVENYISGLQQKLFAKFFDFAQMFVKFACRRI